MIENSLGLKVTTGAYKDEESLDNFDKILTDTWDNIKEHIGIRFINRKYIPSYNEDIAYQRFLDLAKTIAVQEKEDNVYKSHMLTNSDLEKLGVSFEDALLVAERNTETDRRKRVLPFKEYSLKMTNPFYAITKIEQQQEESPFKSAFDIEDIDEDSNENILMASSTTIAYGASFGLTQKTFMEVAERFNNENFYIIPMSIHQVMFVKQSYASGHGRKTITQTEDDLGDMLYQINDSMNKNWRDILSYHFYYHISDDGHKTIML